MILEKYLVLNKYFLSLFGVKEFRELQEKLKDTQIGVDSEGRTYFSNILRSLEGLKIEEDLLLKYDSNIQNYVKKINYNREPVSLKYFQYLAVLFSEIFFDNIKNRKKEFLNEINKFLENYKREEEIEIINKFTENDFKKIAFWMATGSGKTLIMHINYYQFFHYNLFSPDNIILITPNLGLSKQHFEELQKSGIPARLYSGGDSGRRNEKEVLVIEMTKFVEEKKGGGVTLPVETFEGKNLIFVDEGHKGKRAEEQKWARLRNELSKDGFVLEYSATFGQILSERNKEILEEYAKAIIFDYSYKYFYLDGYGKDFSILNIKNPTQIGEGEFQETMFIANLLSYYEQLLVYEENKNKIRDYNIEKPLWIFVGTTVIGKKNKSKQTKDEKETISDVIQIVKFIKKVSEDEDWLKENIEKILNGQTSFKNENNEDIFKERLKYIRDKKIDINDIYQKIFNGKGKFSLFEIKNAEGEIGLKVGDNKYFGVINIGDVGGFKKELEKEGIEVNQDVISSSLFDNIKREDSEINILIGSKKFIEGWDTWRVSSMGLLNIGKGQGPQIIQLFGRGVRLKGKNFSLKRSGDSLEIKTLETLNIYSIKADYLTKFLEAINKEVELETIEIPINLQHKEKWEELYILAKGNKKFEKEEILKLEIDDKIKVSLDLVPRISEYLSSESREKIRIEDIKSNAKSLSIPQEILILFDWQRILNEIYEFKKMRGYWNLFFDINTLNNLLSSDVYKIIASDDIFKIEDRKDLDRLEEITILIIKNYIDKFYRKHRQKFETENLEYEKLANKQLPLFTFEKRGNEYVYTLQIEKEKKKKKLIKKIKELIKNIEELKKDAENELPRVYFDYHLYFPILCKSKKINKISPEGLNEGEKDFVIGLKEYLTEKPLPEDTELYLLRNYPKSGVGFQLEWYGFYPDFIMWIKKKDKQIIIFIDPKGLEHTKDLNDEKIVFAGFKPQGSDVITIKDIENKLKSQKGFENIQLESFIISATLYDELIKGKISPPSKDDYISRNVLFLYEQKNVRDEECFKKLLEKFI